LYLFLVGDVVLNCLLSCLDFLVLKWYRYAAMKTAMPTRAAGLDICLDIKLPIFQTNDFAIKNQKTAQCQVKKVIIKNLKISYIRNVNLRHTLPI